MNKDGPQSDPAGLRAWLHDARMPAFDPDMLGRMQWVIDWWRRERGFAFASLPWWAPESCMAHTRPPFALADVSIEAGSLLASGEQAFLGLHAAGVTASNSCAGWIGWSPCFRNEQGYATGRHHAFMKAELFVPTPAEHWEERCRDLLEATLACWRGLAAAVGLPPRQPAILRIGSTAHDIVLGGVELGSFGLRRALDGSPYLYGTALAEPRWWLAWSGHLPLAPPSAQPGPPPADA